MHAEKLILVVEDDETLRFLVAKQLAKLGHKSHFARNGKEGVSMACSSVSYDIILMDLSMPVLDGIEATRQIRQYEDAYKKERIPIIALTALSERYIQATQAGMDDSLFKPVMIESLTRIIEKWCPH